MSSCLALPRELTIYTVGELRPQWLDQLAADNADPVDPWPVDAAAVEDVDAAGLQLLQSLSNSLAREQRRLLLQRPSAALVAACNALGLPGLLAPPPAQARPAAKPTRAAKAKPAARKTKETT
jgi:anti-anti-sigma regulatory factor